MDFIILLVDSKIKYLTMKVSNSVIESSFIRSSFIKESKMTNFGSIDLNNVTFIIYADETSLIHLNGELILNCSFKLTG